MRKAVTRLACLFVALMAPCDLCGQASPAGAPEKPDYSKEASVIELLSQKVDFRNDGTSTSESTVRVRLQSDAGVKQYGLLVFQYQQANETPEILSVRVRKPDGSTVNTPAENIQDLPAEVAREAPFYSDLRQKHVAVRGLGVGDTLEYQIRTRTHTPLVPGHFWLVSDFIRNAIVLEETLEVSVPAERNVNTKFGDVKPTVTEADGRRIYHWKTSNLKRKTEDELKAEPDEPPPPAVQLTTFQNFAEVGRWYEALQRERVEPTPEIRAKAAEVTKDARSDAEKLQAIYRYVALSFRYIGIAFGMGRYQPHPAADVLANQYGDCKDKHTLLASLLKAAGITAYPALINASRKTDSDVPSPAQFDHLITAVPQGEGYLWLDSTPEVAPFGFLLAVLRDKEALVIPEGKAPVMVKTPADPPFSSSYSFRVEGKLNDAGTLDAKVARTLRGDFEILLRAAFRRVPQPQWKDLVQTVSYSSGFGGTVSNVEVSAPEATDAPFRFSYDYNRKEYSDWANHRISMPCPPFGLPVLKDEQDEKRDKLKLGVPLEFVYDGKVEVPKDYSPSLPAPVDLKEDFAEYHATYAFTDGVLRSERRLTVKVKEIPKEKFEAYRKFVKATNTDESRYVKLTHSRLGKAGLLSMADWMSADDLNSAAAKLLDEKKNYRLAIDLLRKATTIDPNHKRAWNNLGRAYFALGTTSEAEIAYKKQIEINPKDEDTYKNLGTLYFGQKKYDEAVAAYRKHLEFNPLDKEAYGYLGWTLGAMEKWDESAEAYSKISLISPDESWPYVSWGRALANAGKKEEARALFRKAVELDSHPANMNWVAYELAEAGLDLDLAEEWAKQAIEVTARGLIGPLTFDVSPEYWQSLKAFSADLATLGWVFFQKAALDQSESCLITSHLLRADSTVAEHIARLRAKQGNFDEALKYYAYSQLDPRWEGHAAKELENYLIKGTGGRDALLARINEIKVTFADQRLVKPPGGAFRWPENSTLRKPAYVEVAVLVDETGAVTDAKVLRGEEAFQDSALADARTLHLPAITWPGGVLPTLRSIIFIYRPPTMASTEKRVKATWGVGENPPGNITLITPDGEHVVSVPADLALRSGEQDSGGDPSDQKSTPALPEFMDLIKEGARLMSSRNIEGAIARFREAVQSEPNCGGCHQLLAEALMQKGDRSAAIAEYKELVRIEPDNAEHHFTLGAQLEAQGASKMAGAARKNYEAALEQYRLAHELDQENKSYKEAYARLRRRLKHP